MPNNLITTSFKGTDVVLLNKLRGALYSRILSDLVPTIDREDIKLQSYIVRNKLQGQVLHRRSGTLSDSIRAIPAVIKGSTVTGGVEGAGGPAYYGKFFEFGGKGPYVIVPIRKKCLAFMGSDGAMVCCKRVMHPAIPKLPFMKPSLDENAEGIKLRIRESVIRSYNSVVGGR